MPILTKTHRIAPRHVTIADYLRLHRGRKCRAKCSCCLQLWADTKTEYASLAIRQTVPKIGEQEWWCDTCLEKMTVNAEQP